MPRPERCHEGAARVLGSITVDRLTEEELLPKTCGVDWSEAQHDVAIVDDQGRVVARARVSDDAAGFSQLLELLASTAMVSRCRSRSRSRPTRDCSWLR
ncbi:MAG TPA: transposase [Pseudonocardiaceae bacterium]|nr:transposase [Pseudonocardiaceae bacterium]